MISVCNRYEQARRSTTICRFSTSCLINRRARDIEHELVHEQQLLELQLQKKVGPAVCNWRTFKGVVRK